MDPLGETRSDMLKTGLIEVYDSSAIMACIATAGSVSYLGFDINFEIVSG